MSSVRFRGIAFASRWSGGVQRAARMALVIGTTLPFALGASPSRAADAIPTIVVFNFEMVNTSLEPTTPAETARLQRISDALRSALDTSGKYRTVGTQAALDAERQLPSLRECNGCERDVARKLGAQDVAYGWVQKVSNLILNINLVIEDVATGRHVALGSVDIRGNTDESWSHGLHFLLDEDVLSK